MTNLISLFNYNEAYLDVNKIGTLEQEWDGYKGWSGKHYPVEKALSFLTLLRSNKIPAPWVFATNNRSILLEWHYDNRDYLHIEVLSDRLILFRATEHYYCYDKDVQDYKNQDKIIEQVKRWNQEMPFFVQGTRYDEEA